MAVYNVTAGKDRATIELTEETKVVFSFSPNVIAVKASGGSALVSLDQGAQEGDDGASVIADGEATIFEPITDGAIYVSGTATVEVWAGRSGAEIPFRKSAKGGGGSGGDGTHYKGTTTTAIENGSTTNPITIDGESYTAVFGDVVVYNYTEFVFDGTTWSEFGRPFDTTPTSGSMNAVTSDGIFSALLFRKGYASSSIARASLANNANGQRSMAIGYATNTTSADMVVLGKFNSPITNDLFEIGNGTGTTSLERSNIVEVNSTSLNVNGDIKRNGVGIDDYSTTERKIGKWIDGSDLYQRTFVVTGLTNGSWNNNVLGTSGISIQDVQGYVDWLYNDADNVRTSTDYFRADIEFVATVVTSTKSDVDILPTITSNGYTVDKAVITIKYTKTQAQSLSANMTQIVTPTEEVTDTPDVEEDDMR